MKHILFVGPEVTDFLNPIANKLKDLGYTVDVLENRKIPRNNNIITKSYSNILNYNELTRDKITVVHVIKYFFTLEFYRDLLTTIFVNYLEGKCRVIKILRNVLARQHFKEIFLPVLNNYDIINFHSLSPGILSFVDSLKPNKKIILSFWGSDLYQINGIKNYYQQLESLKRADIITVHSHEMQSLVLAKFGSELKNKIALVLFGIRDEILDLIDQIKMTISDSDFLQKYGIPENKIRITIGYSSNPICNHLLILDEFENIEPLVKEKIHLLVPMTYGMMPEGYMDQVTSKLNLTQISYTIFDKYLSLNELIKFRIISDILIIMNKSDALSASVIETLYAENLLISALWLPYSPYRKENIFFYETDFLQLKDKVTYAVNNYDKIKMNLIGNSNRVKRLISFSNNYPAWIKIFESL